MDKSCAERRFSTGESAKAGVVSAMLEYQGKLDSSPRRFGDCWCQLLQYGSIRISSSVLRAQLLLVSCWRSDHLRILAVLSLFSISPSSVQLSYYSTLSIKSISVHNALFKSFVSAVAKIRMLVDLADPASRITIIPWRTDRVSWICMTLLINASTLIRENMHLELLSYGCLQLSIIKIWNTWNRSCKTPKNSGKSYSRNLGTFESC